MSVEQLAIDTKIPRSSIDALEEDRFTALPGPVFVKGFFRCCARSLSLDAEVVMALLHEHERAQQQLRAGGRQRSQPQLLGRTAKVATSTSPISPAQYAPASQYSAPQYSTPQYSAPQYAQGSLVPSGLAAPMTRSPVPAAPMQSMPVQPVHAVPGEQNLATGAPIGPLFDLRALAPLMARIGRRLHRSRLLARSAMVVRDAANSRWLMWIAVSLMIAVIVATAFIMAGGGAPILPQS